MGTGSTAASQAQQQRRSRRSEGGRHSALHRNSKTHTHILLRVTRLGWLPARHIASLRLQLQTLSRFRSGTAASDEPPDWRRNLSQPSNSPDHHATTAATNVHHRRHEVDHSCYYHLGSSTSLTHESALKKCHRNNPNLHHTHAQRESLFCQHQRDH